jgi:site-specific DNA-methyltransferase (adenine-specific)
MKGASKNHKKIRNLINDLHKDSPHKQPDNVGIIQEDCINFLKKIPDGIVDIIVTDPAYSGMNQKMKFGNGRIVGDYQKEGNCKWFTEFHDTKENYSVFLEQCNRVLKENSPIYIMFDSFSLLSLGNLVRDYFNVKNIVVWDKMNMGMGHNFRRRHEFIIYATKGKSSLLSKGIPDVWQIKKITSAKYPTQKPVKVFENMLKASIKSNALVCDPFLGSGSSAIAALKNGCLFVGADVSPKACNLSIDRVNQYVKNGTDVLEEAENTKKQKSILNF